MEELLVKQLYDFATGKKEDIPIEFHYVYKILSTWKKRGIKPFDIDVPMPKDKADFRAFCHLIIENMNDKERKACRPFFKSAFDSLNVSDASEFDMYEIDNEFWRKLLLYFYLCLNIKRKELDNFIEKESWAFTDDMIKGDIREYEFYDAIDTEIALAAPEYGGFFIDIGRPDYKYDNPDKISEYEKDFNLGPF